jgi:diguanylate cyclase (GGDEF)-like protein
MAGNLAEMQSALYSEHNALERESGHLQTILNGVDAVVLEANPETCLFSYVSKEAGNLLDFEIKEWFQKDFWRNHIHPDDLDLFNKNLDRNKDAGSSFSLDYRLKKQSGEYVWVRSINNVEHNDQGKPIIRGLLIDINEQKNAEGKIIYLAEHDALTGLLNRRRFQEELDKSIAFAQRFNHQSALLFIDLDQFKYINDSLGHQGGDEYLIAVSKCLAKAIRDVDIIGRLGGDEFGIILSNVSEEEVAQIAHKLLKTLSEEVLISQGLLTHISASIGATMFPAHGTVTSELLAKADAAMYAIKGQGRNGFHMYMDQDKQLLAMQEKIHWEDRIKRALKDDLFLFHYQPIIDMESREITHYEVLLRMYDKENDQLIMPGAFLETAERFGLIKEIDLWVLENAIRKLGAQHLDNQSIKLAVNLSGRNFGNKDLLKDLEKWFGEYKANPESLIFEVTETAAVENLAQARDFIESLRALGCKFALDDFGVGFSTLHYLKHLPVDYIKIDGSFVRKLHVEPRDRIFIKAICDIADGLGIYTIAEFVENETIDKILGDLGVDLGQGFYYGKPLASLGPHIQDEIENNLSTGS